MSQVLFTLQNAAFMLLTFLEGEGGGGWSIKNFAKNGKAMVGDIGVAILIILGAVMIIVALVKLGTGLLSHGKKQTEWVPIAVLGIVGILFIAGAALVKNLIADNGAGQELNNKLNSLGTDNGYTEEDWGN